MAVINFIDASYRDVVSNFIYFYVCASCNLDKLMGLLYSLENNL